MFNLNIIVNREAQKNKKNSQNKQKETCQKDDLTGRSFFWELVKTVVLAILIVAPIKIFIIQPFFVHGASMEPNFHDGDYLIVKELGYKTTVVEAGEKEFFTVKPYKNIKRGEVIVFRNPNNQKQFFIKRVIGLPGEKVVIAQGRVYIYNDEHPEGFLLDEKEYLPSKVFTSHPRTFQLKDNQYVVLGDNRGNSSDSRYWGILDGDLIIGKVSLRAWPLGSFKIF